MSSRSKEHINHTYHLIINYVLLFFIFLIGGLSLVLLGDQMMKMVILASLAVTYLIWGAWHHHQHGTLNKDVLLEYLGVIGIIIMIFLLVS